MNDSQSMMVSQISSINRPISQDALNPVVGSGTSISQSGTSFSELFTKGIEQVNTQLLTSQVDLRDLASGKSENLHQVMIRLEESRLSFQLMMQVRNRVLEAYQEVMKMQI